MLVSSQLHALRLKREWTQKQFAQEADMKQSRVSAMEQPGAVNFNLETLVRAAAVHGVGLQVKFVPFSEMLEWENKFNQDEFSPLTIVEDTAFLNPVPHHAQGLRNAFVLTFKGAGNLWTSQAITADSSMEQQPGETSSLGHPQLPSTTASKSQPVADEALSNVVVVPLIAGGSESTYEGAI